MGLLMLIFENIMHVAFDIICLHLELERERHSSLTTDEHS